MEDFIVLPRYDNRDDNFLLCCVMLSTVYVNF